MKRATLAILALAAMPAVALAQDSTGTGGQRDSTRTGNAAAAHRGMRPDSAHRAAMGATRSEHMGAMQRQTESGRRSSSTRSMNLTSEQVTQLQTALSGIGCDAGTADGVIGPKTRRAISCAKKKNNVSSNAELYQSLNLDFSSTGAAGAAGARWA